MHARARGARRSEPRAVQTDGGARCWGLKLNKRTAVAKDEACRAPDTFQACRALGGVKRCPVLRPPLQLWV
eukprot:7376966-Prymnesium_polylepis.1